MGAGFALVVITKNCINYLPEGIVVPAAGIPSMTFPDAGSIVAGYLVFSGCH